MTLPEATREDKGDRAAFSVRKKRFAYYLHDHHGDGIVSVCFKVSPGTGPFLIDSDPELFYLPAYIGPRGWVGLRLDLDDVDWALVANHVTESYRLIAPKRLAARVEEPPI
jgi:predicted DNA-binding protein (MmcQ/YjbR family)